MEDATTFEADADFAKEGTYWNYIRASSSHAVTMMLRQQRLIMAAVIAFLPVILPLAVSFLSSSPFAADGLETFVQLTEEFYINVLSPILALFFATMLVGEEAEKQTITYVLTRPMPRSAWVVGRFLAYLLVSSAILVISTFLTFAACTSLEGFSFSAIDLQLFAHYAGVLVVSLYGYGALTLFLGAVSKRPVIIGVIVIYVWQPMAQLVPGIVGLFTIRHYTDALLPRLASERGEETTETILTEFQQQLYLTQVAQNLVALIFIGALFIGLTVVTVRIRQYATDHAVGA